CVGGVVVVLRSARGVWCGLFFFFQAEDGIRYWSVTGVQTCALPVLDPRGNAALIAAGTGLGEALLFNVDGKLVPGATEGGHVDFSPIDAEMDAFLVWMRDQIGHVSAERVVSGIGIEALYNFYHDPDLGSRPHVAPGGDVAAAVSENAASGACGGCSRAMGFFLRAYGAEAGNLAL